MTENDYRKELAKSVNTVAERQPVLLALVTVLFVIVVIVSYLQYNRDAESAKLLRLTISSCIGKELP